MRPLTALILITLVAVVAVSPATAHVTIVPPFAAAGSEARLVLDVPNESPTKAMTSLRVTVPPGMEIRAGEPLGSWRATVTGREARWSGGALAPRQTARFALVVLAPRRAGALVLRAEQGYPDGGTVPWRVELTITPADTGGDQHFGAAALAGAVGLAVIGASLVVLRRLRRRPLQDR